MFCGENNGRIQYSDIFALPLRCRAGQRSDAHFRQQSGWFLSPGKFGAAPESVQSQQEKGVGFSACPSALLRLINLKSACFCVY